MYFDDFEDHSPSIDYSLLRKTHPGLNRRFLDRYNGFTYLYDSSYGLMHLNDPMGFSEPLRSCVDRFLLLTVI